MEKNWKAEIENVQPLIHCITNQITMLECANMILALNGRPIMAEHPGEVAEITKDAGALVLNLGNISDVRMQAMKIAGQTAQQHGIPILVDLVGVGCSKLRRIFAEECIEAFRPQVLKGNMSEIKAVSNQKSHAVGVDVGKADELTGSTLNNAGGIAGTLAREKKCIVVATGETDIITDGRRIYYVHNGCEMMSRITGSGCMLSAIMGTFAGSHYGHEELIELLVYAAAMFGICGEDAFAQAAVGSGRTRLFDIVDEINDEEIRARMEVERNESI